jgi:ABC-type dipeptide/oligopeptide/nickel transport system permease component
MLKLLRQRLLDFIPMLLITSMLVFGLLYMLPGDPVSAMMSGSGASAEVIELLRHQLGLDQPVYVQYWRFLSRALVGDLGQSISSHRDVTEMIAELAPSTLQLAAAAVLIAVLVGVPLGVVAAVYRNTWVDRLAMLTAMIGVSMPQFWLALLALFLFSFRLGWVPATGVGGWQRLVLPAAVLGFGSAAAISRMVRASMLEVLSQEYVTAARGRGVQFRDVVMRHAFRNALIPVVTIIGLQIGWLAGGAVIVETIFSRPGIGRLLVQAIAAKDFPVVQAIILYITMGYLLINLATDIAYGLLDPRVRV